MGEYLQMGGSGEAAFVQCTYCGRRICPAQSRWKDQVPTRKVSVASAGPGRKDTALFCLREFFCPGCATQLDVEVICQDDLPLYDEITPVALQDVEIDAPALGEVGGQASEA